MKRYRVLAVLATLALVLGLVPAAQAQSYFAISYWSAAMNVASGTGTWNTGFIVLDYSGVLRPPFGLRFTYGTGAQGNWGGPGWAGLTSSGTDSFWSADLFWQRSAQNATFRPFVGYGSMQYMSTFPATGTETWQVSGFRVGAELSVQAPNSPLRFFAVLAYYPSVNQHFVDDGGAIIDASGTGTAVEYVLGMKFIPQGRNWGMSAGWRGLSHSCTAAAGCIGEPGYGWSGWFIGFSLHR